MLAIATEMCIADVSEVLGLTAARVRQLDPVLRPRLIPLGRGRYARRLYDPAIVNAYLARRAALDLARMEARR